MTMIRAELEAIYPSHPGCCCSILISMVDPVGTWADHQIHPYDLQQVVERLPPSHNGRRYQHYFARQRIDPLLTEEVVRTLRR